MAAPPPAHIGSPSVAAEAAPELWQPSGYRRDLKAYHLAHQTFAGIDALDQAIHRRG